MDLREYVRTDEGKSLHRIPKVRRIVWQPQFVAVEPHHYGQLPMTLVEQLRAHETALTVADLAQLLGVAIRTVYKEVEDGRIPFFRLRTSIRFDPGLIADWLQAKMPPQSFKSRYGTQLGSTSAAASGRKTA